MAKKLYPDGSDRQWPMMLGREAAMRMGDPYDDEAQEARWEQLAHEETVIDLPGEAPRTFGPLSPPGTKHYMAVRLRCGAPGCGAIVGTVWCLDGLWQGRAFTWAELHRVTSDDKRRPVGRVARIILDSVTASSDVAGECPRHGMASRPVRDILADVPRGIDRLAGGRKPANLGMIPAQ